MNRFFAFLFLCLPLIFTACEKNTPKSPTGGGPTGLHFILDLLDAGQLPPDLKKIAQLEIENIGTSRIENILLRVLSGPVKIVQTCKSSLTPGEMCSIQVEIQVGLNPKSYEAKVELKYRENFEDGSSKEMNKVATIKFNILKPGALSLSHSQYSFDQQQQNLTKDMAFQLKNIGETTVDIKEAVVVSTSTGTPFSLSHDCPAKLGGGESCTLTVTSLAAEIGKSTGYLVIRREGIFDLSMPLQSDVTYRSDRAGIAIKRPYYISKANSEGYVARHRITLSNEGGVRASGIITSLAKNESFRIVPRGTPSSQQTCRDTLPAGEQCILEVEFFGTSPDGNVVEDELTVKFSDRKGEQSAKTNLRGSFINCGEFPTHFSARPGVAAALTSYPTGDGRILIVGYGEPTPGDPTIPLFVTRHHCNGQYDRSFQDMGTAEAVAKATSTSGPVNVVPFANGVLLVGKWLPTTYIPDYGTPTTVATHYSFAANTPKGVVLLSLDGKVRRFQDLISPDNTFGNNGLLSLESESGTIVVNDVASAPNGTVAVAGKLRAYDGTVGILLEIDETGNANIRNQGTLPPSICTTPSQPNCSPHFSQWNAVGYDGNKLLAVGQSLDGNKVLGLRYNEFMELTLLDGKKYHNGDFGWRQGFHPTDIEGTNGSVYVAANSGVSFQQLKAVIHLHPRSQYFRGSPYKVRLGKTSLGHIFSLGQRAVSGKTYTEIKRLDHQ